jgi:hypothetical protein
MITGILIGVAGTAAFIYVYELLASYIRYREMREWMIGRDIDPEEIDKDEFSKLYTLWQLSKLPNIEIEHITKE